jgi:predicted transposase YdaD
LYWTILIRRVLDKIGKLKGKQRELAVEQLAILAGLRGLELELVKEAGRYMPFVIDLMENRIYRKRYERGLAEGRAEGLAKGLAKGLAEGELKVLRAQLKRRFGRLPVWAQKRLDRATAEQIEAWSLKLLDAGKLEDVLGKR